MKFQAAQLRVSSDKFRNRHIDLKCNIVANSCLLVKSKRTIGPVSLT